MPFGCHCREAIKDIGEQYLTWLLTLPNLSPNLRWAIGQQLDVQERTDWLESAERHQSRPSAIF